MVYDMLTYISLHIHEDTWGVQYLLWIIIFWINIMLTSERNSCSGLSRKTKVISWTTWDCSSIPSASRRYLKCTVCSQITYLKCCKNLTGPYYFHKRSCKEGREGLAGEACLFLMTIIKKRLLH